MARSKSRPDRHKIFGVLACVGQLAALFPFAVIGLGADGTTPAVWQFIAVFAVWTAFREIGWGIGSLAERFKDRTRSIKLHPLINLIARLCCLLPAAIFIVICVLLRLSGAMYLYILPPAVAICYGGCASVGKSYSDVFTKGWFAVYPISAILASIMLAAAKITDNAPWAGRALCVGFAAEILLFVISANQANIDKCTKQRDKGKAVLPRGLRRYNAVIVAAVFAVSLGLFLFAEPIGTFLFKIIAAVAGAVMYVLNWITSLFDQKNDRELTSSDSDDHRQIITSEHGGSAVDLLMTITAIAITVLVIVYRKPLWNAIKRLFASVFKNREAEFDTPFADEITSSDRKLLSRRAERKAERELAKRYARETSPERKYRLGYALFLARLRHTAYPPAPSDTTDAHRKKGETAWQCDLSGFSGTYGRVRYGDVIPTSEELADQDEILQKITKKSRL